MRIILELLNHIYVIPFAYSFDSILIFWAWDLGPGLKIAVGHGPVRPGLGPGPAFAAILGLGRRSRAQNMKKYEHDMK